MWARGGDTIMAESVKQEWRTFGSLKGEHIWQGDKHIADIVDSINNPVWNKTVNEIAKSAILIYNDPRYKATPQLIEACKSAESVLASVMRGGTIHIDKIRGAKEQLRSVLSEIGE